MRSRRWSVPALAVIAVLLVGACGDDDTDTVSAPAEGAGAETDGESVADGAVEVVAEDIAFGQDSYSVTAGEVPISYVNEGSIRHTLVIEDVDGFKLDVASAGDVDEGSVELEAGEYVLFCDVPGHRAAGMEAVLTVS